MKSVICLKRETIVQVCAKILKNQLFQPFGR
uniref:Uncharacterized protein n=1 Tax=Anguilla anguilla TaxID=7936 RepID=A0A0E9QIL3_ANGAN